MPSILFGTKGSVGSLPRTPYRLLLFESALGKLGGAICTPHKLFALHEGRRPTADRAKQEYRRD